jgi:hypothetical protein
LTDPTVLDLYLPPYECQSITKEYLISLGSE